MTGQEQYFELRCIDRRTETAWKLRVEKNEEVRNKKRLSPARDGLANKKISLG
jgi:hypothetical protein